MEIPARSFPWMVFCAEMMGTALLVAVGVSFVILDFGQGSPVLHWIPGAGWRRLITGFLFGTTGGLIALSPLGKESGAHINPAVTLSFWLIGKLRPRDASIYVFAQLAGAVLGAIPLLAWRDMGRSIAYGATLPGPGYGPIRALLGETAATSALVFGLFFFLRHRKLRPFTPALFPVLYAVMVFAEGPVSGTSTNPARSLAPALVSGNWHGWWVYWLGPFLGALLGVILYRSNDRWSPIEVAKLHHFEHDRYGLFRA